MSKVAQSKELIFEIIASVIPTEITFNKLVWTSEFRCVFVPSIPVDKRLGSINVRANIRMVNKFNVGGVFVAGGI
jgi:hypothetical protein